MKPQLIPPDELPHPGLTLRATHRVLTDTFPPAYHLTEASAINMAETRLPRPSAIELYTRHHRTEAETWEFWRVYP